jgi:ABC-type multidrug transport system fused ATPase/permease subunit
MNRTVLALNTKQRVGQGHFNPREFRRMLAVTWPFRGYLIVGVLLTMVFASLHTVSLAGAFPIFKILLEEEGLRGWIARTVAGDRLGLEFSPPTEQNRVRIVDVRSAGAGATHGLRENDLVLGTDETPIGELLALLANHDKRNLIPIEIERGGERFRVQVFPQEPSRSMRALGAAATWIPADADTASGKLRTLVYILVGMLTLVISANLFRFWGEVLIAQSVLRGLMALRVQLYKRTLHLPMSFFAGQSTADIVGRFVQDMQEMQRGLLTLFGRFLREPLRAILILGAALFLDWRLTLALLVVVPVTMGIFWLVGRSVKKANHKLLRGYGQMIDTLTTSLHNLRVVKAYTAEEYERARLTSVDLKMFRQQLKLARLQAMTSPLVETLAILAGCMVTLWLANRVLSHDIEVAKFVMLGVFFAYLFDPVRKLTDVYVRVLRSTAGAERVFQVLDHPIEVDGSGAASALPPLARAIEYRDVTYTYPGAERPAVSGVSLAIAKGETVALVGPNGSGKTTLVSMLLRFFDPDEGAILHDGVDLRKASLKSLRSQIGLVTQDTIIFAGTPVDNIAYGMAHGDGKLAEEAARRARADEFIRALPGGYHAVLGERGNTLSGGQRQRLAIARAIFRNAPILIFDEATSQVDTESELQIQTALQDFARDRTTVIIAHRLSTIQFADRIVVMDAGRVVDTGAHGDLFQRCPLYRTLCETQFVTEPAGVAEGG